MIQPQKPSDINKKKFYTTRLGVRNYCYADCLYALAAWTKPKRHSPLYVARQNGEKRRSSNGYLKFGKRFDIQNHNGKLIRGTSELGMFRSCDHTDQVKFLVMEHFVICSRVVKYIQSVIISELQEKSFRVLTLPAMALFAHGLELWNDGDKISLRLHASQTWPVLCYKSM